ncbi:Uncharacterised protein [uncultured archaeon]|nr:Uncharacterised protein [uncultured archaeon]
MLVENKPHKGFYLETDAALSAKFTEAGFGFEEGFTPLEAGYLVKIKRASFESGTLDSFVAAQKKKDKIFPFALEVYFQIRSTGRMVRPYSKGIKYLRAYAPGVGRLQERPSQLIALLPGSVPSAKTLADEVKVAHLARLDLIIATGTEKEIRYYKISSFNW